MLEQVRISLRDPKWKKEVWDELKTAQKKELLSKSPSMMQRRRGREDS